MASSVGEKRERYEDCVEDADVKSMKKRFAEAKPWSCLLSRDTLFQLGRGLSSAGSDAGEEVWNLYGWLGRRQEYAFFASFKSYSLFHSSNAELEDLAVNPSHAGVLQWCFVEPCSETYYCFSECDHRGANVLLALMSQKPGHFVENSVFGEAIAEQLHLNNFIFPDKASSKRFSSVQGIVDLQYGDSYFKCNLQKGGQMTFSLHLEGISNASVDNEEIHANIDVSFTVATHPVLDGNDEGCVGLSSWHENIFRYFVPSCRITNAQVKIVGGKVPLYVDLKNGSVWLEHEISHIRPHTIREARILRELSIAQLRTPCYVERCCLTVVGDAEYTVSVSRLVHMDSGVTLQTLGLVQKSKEKPVVYTTIFNHDRSKQYRSSSTGILFSTSWSLKLENESERSTLDLQVSAAFQKQEFVSMLASPCFWSGVVSVEGVIHSDGKQKESVLGMGFLKCSGKRNIKEIESLFSALRSSSVVALEKDKMDVGTLDDALTKPQILSSVSSISVLLQMQGLCLTGVQKFMVSVFLSTYNVIYHSCDVKDVERALEWCYGKWMSFVSTSSISYLTVFLRAFILRELRHALTCSCYKKLLDRFPNTLCTVDIVNPSSLGFLCNVCMTHSFVPSIPSDHLRNLSKSSALVLSVATAAFHGTYKEGRSLNTGSSRLLLLCEGAPLFWRYQQSLQQRTLSFSFDSKCNTVKIEQTSFMTNYCIELPLSGKEVEWECMFRGTMLSKAILLSEGERLYVETRVNNGIERIWYSVCNSKSGKILKEEIYYFSNLEDNSPTTTLFRTYDGNN